MIRKANQCWFLWHLISAHLTIAILFCFYQIADANDIDIGLNRIITTGYIEAYFYPPHNEYDPNPGIEFKDRVVARYGLEIYTEAKYKNFPLYLFLHPFVLFGDSRPQISYNYKSENTHYTQRMERPGRI